MNRKAGLSKLKKIKNCSMDILIFGSLQRTFTYINVCECQVIVLVEYDSC